jgi:hypothetical protein
MKTKETGPIRTNEPDNKKRASTYSLLLRSEEKKRGVVETVVYGLVILSAVAAILQFADEVLWFRI